MTLYRQTIIITFMQFTVEAFTPSCRHGDMAVNIMLHQILFDLQFAKCVSRDVTLCTTILCTPFDHCCSRRLHHVEHQTDSATLAHTICMHATLKELCPVHIVHSSPHISMSHLLFVQVCRETAAYDHLDRLSVSCAPQF